MRFNTKLFVVLFLAGLTGVISFLLIDLNGLINVLPVPPETEIPQVTFALKLLSLIQPTILLTIAVFLGVALASKIGLSSPVAEAFVSGGNMVSAFKSQFISGIAGGIAGGAIIVSIASVWKPFFPREVAGLISEFGKFVPLATRLLYGGITEELLLRWGLMTLLVWTGWRVFQKKQGEPKPFLFVGAILVSSFIFGVGHLPAAFFLFPEPTVSLTLFVIVGNSAFGLIAGYLYWRKGLESAVIAHMTAHVVMFAASYFGAYF